MLARGEPPVVTPPAVPQSSEGLSLWLIVRAFASGCTAMTGVEAVSNGIDAFGEPRVRRAHGTLALIVVILAILLLGIAAVARGYGIMAVDQSQQGYESVLSQVASATWGRGTVYYVSMGAVLAVLCLSANTSFVGFPRLCRMIAHDHYLPRTFASPGRRLVYSAGIAFLTMGAGALLIAFAGITDRLSHFLRWVPFQLSRSRRPEWQHTGCTACGRTRRLRLAPPS
jgi:amino acid transporter